MIDINLNCDMAEGFGIYQIGSDAALLDIVGSANVACGFHAGDPTTMRSFVARAQAAGVSIGAHPGFPDVQGFGRRRMSMTPAEVEDMVLYQIGALQAIAYAAGARVSHVKPHGALANMAAEQRAYADAISRAAAGAGSDLILVALAGSEQHQSAYEMGIRVAREGYTDRLYADDGNLASRSLPGSLFHDPAAAVAQALRMVLDRKVITQSGRERHVEIDTICIHGDGPGAVEISSAVRDALAGHGARLCPLDSMNLTPAANTRYAISA
jgi:5-oxoprolinase (ATP-hydrolysing) subunit A